MNNVSGVGSGVLGALTTAPSVKGDSNDAPVIDRDLSKTLKGDVFAEGVCGFLQPKDLCACIRTCKAWNQSFLEDGPWENLCGIFFGANALPKRKEGDPSYKEVFQRLHNRILGKPFYERYIGSVGQVPPIPSHFSPFALLDMLDPVTDPLIYRRRYGFPLSRDRETIGQAYVWVWVPARVEFEIKEAGGVKTQEIPLTLNSLPKLFANPREGHSAEYSIWSDITRQHGNTEYPAGWICMRKKVVDRGQGWEWQQVYASDYRLRVSNLFERLLLNCLWRVRSGGYVDVYSWPSARTSTIATRTYMPRDPLVRAEYTVCCGEGCSGWDTRVSGPSVTDGLRLGEPNIGVALAIPEGFLSPIPDHSGPVSDT